MSHFEINRILIANPYGIGDVLFTTPLITALRKNFPASYIAFLAGSRTKEVLEANPEIDEIFVFDRDVFRSKPKIQSYIWLLGFIKSLKKKRFDVYIDLSNTSIYGLLGLILGARRRIGFDYKNRGRFLNFKIPLSGFENKHVIEYYLELLKFLPACPVKAVSSKFYLPEETERWADEFLNSHGLKESTLVGIHPWGGKSWGKTAYVRWWPEENFFSLAQTLAKKYRVKIMVFSEPSLEISASLPPENKEFNCNSFVFPKDLSLTQFAALVKKCHLFISNDGGPLQVAVGVGTPTVSIFGPVSEIVYGPYPPAEKHQVVTKGLNCQPCYQKFSLPLCKHHHRCLSELSEDEVLAKVERLLGHFT